MVPLLFIPRRAGWTAARLDTIDRVSLYCLHWTSSERNINIAVEVKKVTYVKLIEDRI